MNLFFEHSISEKIINFLYFDIMFKTTNHHSSSPTEFCHTKKVSNFCLVFFNNQGYPCLFSCLLIESCCTGLALGKKKLFAIQSQEDLCLSKKSVREISRTTSTIQLQMSMRKLSQDYDELLNRQLHWIPSTKIKGKNTFLVWQYLLSTTVWKFNHLLGIICSIFFYI